MDWIVCWEDGLWSSIRFDKRVLTDRRKCSYECILAAIEYRKGIISYTQYRGKVLLICEYGALTQCIYTWNEGNIVEMVIGVRLPIFFGGSHAASCLLYTQFQIALAQCLRVYGCVYAALRLSLRWRLKIGCLRLYMCICFSVCLCVSCIWLMIHQRANATIASIAWRCSQRAQKMRKKTFQIAYSVEEMSK